MIEIAALASGLVGTDPALASVLDSLHVDRIRLASPLFGFHKPQ
jgi:hypothetical protein